MEQGMDYLQKVENSITNKFANSIWIPFLESVQKYQLINDGDKIAVCISGGKDSMLLAKLVQLLKAENTINFDVEYLVIDPGYNAVNRQMIEHNAEKLGIPINVFESDIFDIANSTGKSPCYLCARMRRGHLYAKAREYGCNKIALGHHFSDVIETTLIGMFYGSQLQGMMPKLHSTNFEGMELIRPLYSIHEDDVIAWRDYNDLQFIQCACKFTENVANYESTSKRKEIKLLVKEWKKQNPDIEQSIFDAIHNVKLDDITGYKTNGKEYLYNQKD